MSTKTGETPPKRIPKSALIGAGIILLALAGFLMTKRPAAPPVPNVTDQPHVGSGMESLKNPKP